MGYVLLGVVVSGPSFNGQGAERLARGGLLLSFDVKMADAPGCV